MKVQVVRSKKGWFFRIVARNGRTLCHSEIYTRKDNCLDTVMSLKSKLPCAKIEEV